MEPANAPSTPLVPLRPSDTELTEAELAILAHRLETIDEAITKDELFSQVREAVKAKAAKR